MLTLKNLIGLIIAAISTLLGLMIDDLYALFQLGISLSLIFGLIMILSHASIVGTIYWRIMFGTYIASHLLGLIDLWGLLAEDWNYPYFALSFLIIYSGTYIFWFIKKPRIGYLDILKLLWAISFFLFPLGMLFFEIPTYLEHISSILLWLIILNFIGIGIWQGNLIIPKKEKESVS